MKNISNIFLNKKVLVYGLGKSGLSTLKFLQNKCEVYTYDDFETNFKSFSQKKTKINFYMITKIKFDQIILSPGIDINNCKLFMMDWYIYSIQDDKWHFEETEL